MLYLKSWLKNYVKLINNDILRDVDLFIKIRCIKEGFNTLESIYIHKKRKYVKNVKYYAVENIT